MANDAAHGDGDQPVNVESGAAVAVSDTVAPAAYAPAPETVPSPVPLVWVVSAYVAGTGAPATVNVYRPPGSSS
jgi:hypothetical protein